MKTQDGSSNFQLMKMLESETKISLWCELEIVNLINSESEEIHSANLEKTISNVLSDCRLHVEKLKKLLRFSFWAVETKECDFITKVIKEFHESRSLETGLKPFEYDVLELLLKVSHYKIVLHSTIEILARTLGLTEFANLFKESLDHIKTTDSELSEIRSTTLVPR